MSPELIHYTLEWEISDYLPSTLEGAEHVQNEHLAAYLERIGVASEVGTSAIRRLARLLSEGVISLRLWSHSGVSWSSRWELFSPSAQVLLILASGSDVQHQQVAPFEAISRGEPGEALISVSPGGANVTIIHALIDGELDSVSPGMSEGWALRLLGLESREEAQALLDDAWEEAGGDERVFVEVLDDLLEGHAWWSEVTSAMTYLQSEGFQQASASFHYPISSMVEAPRSLWSDLDICLRILDPATPREDLVTIAMNAGDGPRGLLALTPHIDHEVRAAAKPTHS